ncbi:NAD(P)/FAD-dependent oxidoreductase [Cupriavidus plantarum]|uniref:NAD(P)/FAD-dependent oxidoreductase n=1 Tax=Cupriavidus plantarum TaxID=942865 RepID=UPI000EAF9F46|nr:FAD/NAD(P)-binding oxidoreductase [Cupriavidus plantarum]RLK30100.1 NADPH-dependent 2,4-dienoyl-CoA reductase/sulfur reductase-like enzyme [Cupriavidus plantarum]
MTDRTTTAAPPATVIVGAGPAGVRAAQTLVRHGVRPLVVDEAPRWGGQIYRQQPPGFERPPTQLYGFEASRARSIHDTFADLLPHVDYLPGQLVWNADARHLDLWSATADRYTQVAWRDIILATGATDRILPVPGWTTPGVYALGGAQIALKFQGCAIGSDVVFAGSGPLLYLVAYQYRKAGARVRAVLDYATPGEQLRAVPAMSRLPGVLAKGLYYVAWLRAHGVPVHQGARLVGVDGDARVSAVRWQPRDAGDVQTIACDALGFGYGLRPEHQLADLLGCRFVFDAQQRAHLVEQDRGVTTVPGVYVAGDGARILGADGAERAGERAALQLLAKRGIYRDDARLASLDTELARIERFRTGIEHAFPFPRDWAAGVTDDTLVCRCEAVTAGDIRETVATLGADEMNRVKALCRLGMGRCQGRMCGAAGAEIVAHACGKPIDAIGRLRGQAPVKPVPISAFAAEELIAPSQEEVPHG